MPTSIISSRLALAKQGSRPQLAYSPRPYAYASNLLMAERIITSQDSGTRNWDRYLSSESSVAEEEGSSQDSDWGEDESSEQDLDESSEESGKNIIAIKINIKLCQIFHSSSIPLIVNQHNDA